MSNQALYLFLAAIILILLVITVNRFIPHHIRNNYLLWLPIGILVIIWFICFRWAYDLYQLITFNSDDIYMHSVRWSKVLLLDFCPLSTVILALSLIIDKSRSISKVFAPIGFIGGMITLVGFVVNPPSDMNTISLWKYIFVGTETNQIYYLMHVVNCMLSIGIITASKTYTKYSVLGTIIFFLTWFGYMQICIHSLNITNNATGMVEGDWFIPNGIDSNYWYCEYGFVYQMWPLPFPIISIVWYTIALIANFLIMYLWNRLCFSSELISKHQPYWHHKFKSLNFLEKIDLYFNKLSKYVPKFLKNNRP